MHRTIHASLILCSFAIASLAAVDASAKGCNGHVDVREWGCAPWDNNNGPKFPHYQAPRRAAPAPVAKVAPTVPQQHAGVAVAPVKSGASVISHDGGTLIGHDGGSLIGHDGGSMRR
jgi:hypothetical protein